MFRKSKTDATKDASSGMPPATKKSAPSLISQDVNLLGNLISDGIIDFDGKIDGNIRAKTLFIRQNAVVNGEATADEIFVFGRVVGTIMARVVTLHATAYVDGIVMHETITIEDGATVDGKLKKTNKPTDDGASFAPDYEAVEPISPAKLMENIRLIASH